MQLSQLWCSPQENFLHNFSCFHCYCYCYCYLSSTIIFYKLILTSFRKTTITQTSFQNYSSVFHTNFTLLKDFIALPYEKCIIVSLLKILIVVAPIFERSIIFNNTWNPYHHGPLITEHHLPTKSLASLQDCLHYKKGKLYRLRQIGAYTTLPTKKATVCRMSQWREFSVDII